ncbi:MAG TPA: phospholipid scramblase-related protein, partial [Polyangiaceae bacterium]
TPVVLVAQRKELGELLGYEARNKYEVRTPEGEVFGFAAEQQKGLAGIVARQFLGHWRTFDLLIFDALRNLVLRAHHPFRWFFQRLEVADAAGRALGALQRRWAWFSKRFDVEDQAGNVVLVVSSPIWKPWTFTFERNGVAVATIRKRWSGTLKEMFLDADNFAIEFQPGPLSPGERRLLLAAALFVDLMYFEKKAN